MSGKKNKGEKKMDYRQQMSETIKTLDAENSKLMNENKDLLDRFFKSLNDGVEFDKNKYYKLPVKHVETLANMIKMLDKDAEYHRDASMSAAIKIEFLKNILLETAITSNADVSSEEGFIKN